MRLDILSIACAIPMFASSMIAAPISIVNANFGAVAITCGLGYAYQSSGSGNCSSAAPQQDFNGSAGFGWTLAGGGTGLTGAGTQFFPPSNFTGFTQALFLQGAGSSASQTLSGFSAGTYVLSFQLGSRFPQNVCCDGNQTVQALVDGSVVGTWALTNSTPFALTTVAFSIASGAVHTLQFRGIAIGDHTAFLSDVAINSSVPEPSSSSLLLLGIAILGFGATKRRSFGTGSRS
jgi:hypothetical protein